MVAKILFFLLFLSPTWLYSQADNGQKNTTEKNKKEQKVKPEKKDMSATQLADKPKIDGVGDDAVWQNIPTAFSGTFTQVSPKNLEPSQYTTDIKIGYTDYALYVLGYMHDPAPGTIAKELGLRDDFDRLADRFGLVLDTYNQGQNAFYFAVTSAGVQLDLYITPNNEDISWDAVWNSAVQITEGGWVAEFEIPWSAMRFAKRPEQVWGVNFTRIVRSQNERSYWSPVDASEAGLVNQSGTLTGINNIDPPLRLQLFPYVSALAGYDGGSNSTSTNFGGGMDLKWGISESFTLDMALIPDFSQVQSDNLVLNLSPYEVQFAENRPFFTEGTELFNKNGLFYSRRVGNVFYTFEPDVPEETSTIVSSPTNAKLINATKISGRTHKGLGVGLFNAVTNAAYVDIEDTVRLSDGGYDLQRRRQMVDPVTNFNIAVVDQSLRNNSNVSLINTNVSRADGGRDANVTGSEFRFRNKKNMYEVAGFGALSYVWLNADPESGHRERIDGHRYQLSVGKVSGNFQFQLMRNVESDNYDINDLGLIQAANEVSHYLWLGYQVFKPVWIINQGGLNLNFSYERLYKPSTYTGAGGNINGWMQFKNFWNASFGFNLDPVNNHDYFEPREEDFSYYFTRLPSHSEWLFIGSDQRKRFAINTEVWTFARPSWDARDWGIWFQPRFRLNNNISLQANLNYTRIKNERAFVKRLEDEEENLKDIIFGDRRVQVLEPSTQINITFNNKMGLSLRTRCYWSRVRYSDNYYSLQKDGHTQPIVFNGDENADGVMDANINYNSFNIDLFYSWQIAPGSFLTFGWKDFAQEKNEDYSPGMRDNLLSFREQPHTHTFSLKLTYFVDYLMVRSWL